MRQGIPEEPAARPALPETAEPGAARPILAPVTTPIRCTSCQHVGLDPGFVEDSGEGSRGDARWVAGAIERGFFGRAKRLGRPRMQIDAYRCPECGHLELFAAKQLGS